jgi:hypothetical protein
MAIADKINNLVNFKVPSLPCGIDSQILGIQSEITNSFNTITSSFAPGSLLSNISSLKSTLKSTISNRIATIVTDQLPGRLPFSLLDDVFNIVQSCSLSPDSPDCRNRINEVANRYTSLGSADQALNALFSILGEEGVDICSAIPNIQLFEDGTEGTYGLPAKIANIIPNIAQLPSKLTDALEVRANSVIDKTFKTHADRFTE